MADNYVGTSVEVDLLTAENVQKTITLYEAVHTFYENDCDSAFKPKVEGAGSETFDDFLHSIKSNGDISFFLFARENSTTVVLGGDEYVDLEEVASFIQFLQQHFNLAQPVLVTWAETCSKLRVNEFSGGAILVHKDHVVWQEGPNIWFNRMCKELNLAN